MISLDKFHFFYNENKDKLFIKNSGTHPIDNDKFSEWIAHQGSENYTKNTILIRGSLYDLSLGMECLCVELN